MREKIKTADAPTPKWPYSQGIATDNLIFVSGQGPANPATGEMQLGDIKDETRLTLDNVVAILKAAGATVNDVLKVHVYLSDINDFVAMNEVYKDYFGESLPARTTVGVALAAGMKVEIDVIAQKP